MLSDAEVEEADGSDLYHIKADLLALRKAVRAVRAHPCPDSCVHLSYQYDRCVDALTKAIAALPVPAEPKEADHGR